MSYSTSVKPDGHSYSWSINASHICPYCGIQQNSRKVSACKRKGILTVCFACINPGCEKYYLGDFATNDSNYSGTLIRYTPTLKQTHNRGEEGYKIIEKIGGNFLEIYQQAEDAEAQGMSYIVGTGYGKALEHLIKDYAIYLNPDDKEKIAAPTYYTSKCIKEYLSDDPYLQSFTEIAGWFRNDMTHYSQRHDITVEDLKRQIKMCVSAMSLRDLYQENQDLHPKSSED